MELIDKDALVAEIEKRKDLHFKNYAEKEILLKDLCARLAYGIAIYRISDNSTHRIQFSDITENISQFSHFLEYSGIDNIKPYLRPMSSMTEKEQKEYDVFCCKPYLGIDETIASNFINWLNAHHFDYRGLIENGLAIEAPEGTY